MAHEQPVQTIPPPAPSLLVLTNTHTPFLLLAFCVPRLLNKGYENAKFKSPCPPLFNNRVQTATPLWVDFFLPTPEAAWTETEGDLSR